MRQFLILSCVVAVCSASAHLRNPNKRAISLFSVVSFDNDPCTTTMSPTMQGVCYTTDECNNKGGTASGNCASGFGVCCLFRLDQTKCGSKIPNNITYIQNTAFPSPLTTTTALTCKYDFVGSSEICQVRLDYDTLTVNQPNANAVCDGDKVTVTSASNYNPPILCGVNTGTHMYIETARDSNPGSITIDLAAVNGDRTWKIKVTYIECSNPSRAPTDCLQYLTGLSNTFKSYNFANRILSNQYYEVCIRQEKAHCSFLLSENSAISTTDNFLVSAIAASGTSKVGTDCATAYISLPTADSAFNRYCGDFLANVGANTKSGTITSEQVPFRVGVVADSVVAPTGTGFNLMYVQKPCK